MQAVEPSDREITANWIRNSVERSDSRLIQCIIPAFASEDWDKWWRASFRVVGLQAEAYHGAPEDAAEMKSNQLRGSVSTVTALLTAIVTVTADTDIRTCVRTAATCVLTADTDILISITFLLAIATFILTAYTDILFSITFLLAIATFILTAYADILIWITVIVSNCYYLYTYCWYWYTDFYYCCIHCYYLYVLIHADSYYWYTY